MCYIDLEPCSVWSESERKARTLKRCTVCDGPIKPGEMYVKHFSVFEGAPTFAVMCSACKGDRQLFAEAHDGMSPTPADFLRLLDECIDEDSEDDSDGWKAMLARIEARGAAAALSG